MYQKDQPARAAAAGLAADDGGRAPQDGGQAGMHETGSLIYLKNFGLKPPEPAQAANSSNLKAEKPPIGKWAFCRQFVGGNSKSVPHFRSSSCGNLEYRPTIMEAASDELLPIPSNWR
jgi:hypothetical protein